MAEEQKEKLNRLKKKHKSLPILLMESDLYDHNPGARMVLMVIALGARTNPDARVPEDMPDEFKDDLLGWCNRAEWGIALRSGKSEGQVQKDIQMFRRDCVIEVRTWRDSNNADHNLYKINTDVVKEHQRPSQKKNVKRPSRYKGKRGANKGSFSSKNQPDRYAAMAAIAGEE